MTAEVITGDARDVLRSLPAGGVRCIVTSPPYYGLRDYGHAGQIGLEATPAAYVAELVSVFREARRVLADDGTLWLNLGDSYAVGGMSNPSNKSTLGGGKDRGAANYSITRQTPAGLKPKDLVGVPWRVAFALQADGWYLRQDIIWHKPNPMPESVRDRCTKAHEYLFLLSKSERYHYDAEAIAEPLAESSIARLSQPTLASQAGSDRVPGKTNGTMKAVGPRFGGNKYGDNEDPHHATKSGNTWSPPTDGLRNKRSVWTVATRPYTEAHFATFPPDLIRPCILAGSQPGDTVLDPFNGSGTTGQVALELGRRYVGIELNPEYVELTHARLAPILAQPNMFQMEAV